MTRRPRFDVCFYAPFIGPRLAGNDDLPPGGAETQILLLSQELVRAGHRVAIISFDMPGLPSDVGGVAIIGQRRPGVTVPLLRTLAYAWSLFSALRRGDAGVVVQRAAGSPTGVVAVLCKLRRRRFVYSSANVIDFRFEDLEPVALNVKLFHLGVRLADDVVVQTDEQRELCQGRFGRDAHVVKSLAEPADPTTAEPEAFLWVGRLTHYKRPEDYVALVRAVPEAQFWLVGVPFFEEGERIEAELRQAETELPNLHLMAHRPRHELLELVDRAVAMVNTAEYEGMPNIFLEAWSRGVPALCLHHDPDGVIGEHGLGAFAAGDADRFAQQARELWTDRLDRSDVSRRCLDYIAETHAPAAAAAQWAAALGIASA